MPSINGKDDTARKLAKPFNETVSDVINPEPTFFLSTVCDAIKNKFKLQGITHSNEIE